MFTYFLAAVFAVYFQPVASSTPVSCSECNCVGTEIDCSGQELWASGAEQIAFDATTTVLGLSNTGLPVLGQTYLELSTLAVLEQLIIVGTSIVSVQTGALLGLNGLTKLDLSNNLIENIDSDAFDNVGTLIELDLSINKIAVLAKRTFQSLVNLVKLNLEGNLLTGLVSGVFQFQSLLTELDVQNNKLTSDGVDPDAFSFTTGADGLKVLSLLRLNKNQLAGITDETFANLGELTQLVMNENEMIDISTNAFADNVKLSSINLRDNEFVTLDEAIFSGTSSLDSLYLAGDYWDCCDLLWATNVPYVKDSSQIVCARPASANTFPLVSTTDTIAIDAITSGLECANNLPNTPEQPYMTGSTSTSLTVEWAVVEGNAYDVDYYRVDLKSNVWTTAVCPSGRSPPLIDAVTTTSSACKVVTDGTSSTSVYSLTMEDLDKAQAYEIRVLAHSPLPGPADDGGSWSDNGAISTFTTREDTPGAINAGQVTTTSPYTVNVYFQKPLEPNGEIIKYDLAINYGALDASTNVLYELICAGTSNCGNSSDYTITHEFQGLNPNTKYIVSITPWTAIQSQGIVTTFEKTTSESPPNAPAAPFLQDGAEATGSTFIKLQWNASSSEDANGVITGYTVYIDPQEAAVSGIGFVEAGAGTTRTISGLLPSNQYTISITASTGTKSGGESPVSPSFVISTAQAAPEQQVPPVGKALSATSITATWESPDVTNGRIIGYQFKLQPTIESEEVQIINTSAAEPYVTIIGLSPATAYKISVSAFNTLASNAFSDESIVVTAESAPSAVSSSAYPISSTEVRLNWTAPESPNGIILSYEVYQVSASQYVDNYDPIVDTQKIALFNTSNSTLSYVHNTAKPFFTYEYSVSATNAAASSPLGEVARVTTLQDIPVNQYAPTVKIQGATEVLLRWSKPEFPNGQISKYEIHTNQNENESPSYSGIPDGDDIVDGKLSVTLVDLKPDTTYRFTVTSFTSQGASDRSAETPGMTATQKASSRIATLVAVLSILIVILSLGFMWEHRLRRSGDVNPGVQPFDLDGKAMQSLPMAEIPGTFSEQRQLNDPFSGPFSGGGDSVSLSSASSSGSSEA